MDTLNPFALMDALLRDYASPRTRRAIHSLLLLVAVIVSIYLSVEGNWKEAVLAMVAAIYAGANQANTPAVDLLDANGDSGDDGRSYKESGGIPYPSLYGSQEPLFQPGSDEDGFGGDAPAPYVRTTDPYDSDWPVAPDHPR